MPDWGGSTTTLSSRAGCDMLSMPSPLPSNSTCPGAASADTRAARLGRFPK